MQTGLGDLRAASENPSPNVRFTLIGHIIRFQHLLRLFRDFGTMALKPVCVELFLC